MPVSPDHLSRPAGAPPLDSLPRPELHGILPAVLVLCAATAATGVDIVVPSFTALLPLVWLGAVAAAATTVLLGIRSWRRQRRLDPAIEAVLPLLGVSPPERGLVVASRWTAGGVGRPGRLRIRYAAVVDDGDPRFVAGILDALSRRLGVGYRVRAHRTDRRVLDLEIAPGHPSDGPRP